MGSHRSGSGVALGSQFLGNLPEQGNRKKVSKERNVIMVSKKNLYDYWIFLLSFGNLFK